MKEKKGSCHHESPERGASGGLGGVGAVSATESIAHYSPSGRLLPSKTCKSIEWDSIKIKYAAVNGGIQKRSEGKGGGEKEQSEDGVLRGC